MTDGLRDTSWIRGIDSPERLRADAFVECPIAHPTLVIRRDVLAAFRYRDAGWPEDYDLVLRLLGAGHAIGVVPRRLVAWRDSPARLTRTGAAYGQERIVACKASSSPTASAGADVVLWATAVRAARSNARSRRTASGRRTSSRCTPDASAIASTARP
jgi:hypothetical protein